MTLDTQNKSLFLPVTLWIGAFICALYPVNEFQLQLFAAAIILMFAWTFTMLNRDIETGWRVASAPVLKFAGLFWVLVICSAFWSDIKTVSLTSVCFFSVMPLTFFGGVLAGHENYFKKLWKPLAAIFAILGVWSVFQFFFLNTYFHGQARHPLADPSSLGGLFSLALFCTLGWIVYSPADKRKIPVTLAVILSCGIMATVSRGPIFAFVPGIIFFSVLLWPRVKEAKRPLLIVLFSALAFYGVMHTGVQKRYDLGQRLLGTVDSSPAIATNNRIDVWSSAIDIIKDHPILGTGTGTFYLYYPEYRRITEIDGVFLAHNDPLQFWVELGIAGPLLFYAFVIAAAIRSFAALKKLPKDHPDRVLISSIFAALVAMVAQSHVSFNLYNLSILMMAGLLLSIWFHATGRALTEPQTLIAMPDNMPRNLNKAMLVLPFLMMGWLFCSITGGEYFAGKARDALFKQDLDGFMNSINKAGKISMGLNYRAYLFAVNVPMAILEDHNLTKIEMSDDQKKKLFDQVEGYMDNVIALNPRSATAYYYMAKIQSLVTKKLLPEDLAPPEDLYKEALRLDPLHLGARLELFKLYQEQGKSNAELIAFMKPASNFYYTTEQVKDYYSALGKLYLESGNYKKVQEIMERSLEFARRAQYSLQRQNTSIPQAIMGGDDALPVQ